MPGLSLKDLPDRLRERFSLSAYTRFVLLFTLFNLMFCILLLLSIQNMQLRESKRNLEGALSTVGAVAATAEQEIEQLRTMVPTSPARLTPAFTPVPALSISAVMPDAGVVGAGLITVTLEGRGFAPGAIVEMRRDGERPVVAMAVDVINPTRMICVLTLADVAPGVWSVWVMNPDQRWAMLPDAFKVCEGLCP